MEMVSEQEGDMTGVRCRAGEEQVMGGRRGTHRAPGTGAVAAGPPFGRVCPGLGMAKMGGLWQEWGGSRSGGEAL